MVTLPRYRPVSAVIEEFGMNGRVVPAGAKLAPDVTSGVSVLVMSASGESVGRAEAWKVGALARASLTVRALHHYDHIGLLSPSMRTAAGHRLYSPEDVARLYRITLLRRLGFPLEQIATVVDEPEWQLAAAMRRHLEHAREQAAAAARLCGRLADMTAALDREDHPDGGQLFSALEEMTMTDTAIRSTTGLLVYDDIAAAHDYIVGVYGLASAGVEHDASGRVIHAEVRAGDQITSGGRDPQAASRPGLRRP